MVDDNGPKSGSHLASSSPVSFRRGETPSKRRDAQANRTRLLEVAAALADERGLHAVSVDEIAERAGVGKGTVYRAFGDKAGLAVALLDHEERELQEAILSGPPPLGRGAPPIDRLVAFAGRYVDFLDRDLDLLLVAEQGEPAARFRNGAYDFWLAHVRGLLGEAANDADGSEGADTEGAAHAVLALLETDLFLHLRRDRHYPLDRVAALVSSAVRGIAGQVAVAT